MASIEEVERRLARVEDKLATLEDRDFHQRGEVGAAVSISSDAIRLARGASQDVSKVEEAQRGHNRVVEALRETQLEQGRKIDGLHENVESLRAEMVSRFDQLAGGMTHIVELLEGLTGDQP